MANYLTADKTVNFTAVDTAATIQAAIDAEPKNLNGYILTFQFADGSYSLNATLLVNGFFGGKVFFQGNMTENKNVLHTNQAVILTNSNNLKVFSISNVDELSLYNFKLVSLNNIVWLDNVRKAIISGNYFLASVTTGGLVLYCSYCKGMFNSNYYTKGAYGIYVDLSSRIFSDNNSSTVTDPVQGLASYKASTIGKNGLQPAGSSFNEVTGTGGVIR